MVAAILIFGLCSGVFLSVLTGLLGSRRNIGFGWAFVLSLLFTPLAGLIFVLLSDPLPEGAERKYGCLGYIFGFLGILLLIALFFFVILGIASAAFA